jgi:hypothetical protein
MTDFLDQLVKDAPALSAVIAALALAIATGTFVKGVIEYRNQNALRRFEKFLELETLFKGDDIYRICMLLEHDSEDLRKIDVKERQKFLGFYELVAIMHNSKILKSEIAHYMFGYYAIRCLDSVNFWTEINKQSGYWALFVAFASDKILTSNS